jgi:hypothetical protein
MGKWNVTETFFFQKFLSTFPLFERVVNCHCAMEKTNMSRRFLHKRKGHNKRMMDGSGHGRHGLRCGLLCGSVKIYLLILSKGKRTNYLIYLLATLVTKRVRMIPILYTAIIRTSWLGVMKWFTTSHRRQDEISRRMIVSCPVRILSFSFDLLFLVICTICFSHGLMNVLFYF